MSDVVGSASFELRATRDKISSDMEAARQDILAASKKTEAELASLVGSGTAEGNKKAAASFEAPKAAANDAGNAIKASMQAAGAEIASAVKAGSDKAKAELDSLAAKAREVQAVQKPWVPDDAYRKATNAPYVPVQPIASPVPNVSAPALMETSEAAKETAKNLDSVGQAGDVATEGLGSVSKGGVAAALGVAGLITGAILVTKTLYEMGTAAMASAGDMADTAKRIGLSTDALQEWRFVAQQTGETAGAADSAIDSFGKKLAGAASQLSKEDVKAFRTLGFEPEQLKSFKTVEEALDVVTDRIKNLASESERAGIAEKLGLGALSTAFKDNAIDIAALRDEAHSLGVVIDADVIQRGAEAQSQFQTLSGVIDGQLKTAFLDLAPAIIAAIGLVAQLATDLGRALDTWRDLDRKTSVGLRDERRKLVSERDAIATQFGTRPLNGQVVVARRIEGGQYSTVAPQAVRQAGAGAFGPGRVPTLPSGSNENWGLFERRVGRPTYTDAGQQFDAADSRIRAIDAQLAERAERAATPPPAARPPGTGALVIPSERTPKGRVDRSAEREARRAERVEAEINKVRARALGIVDAEMQTVQQRFDTAKAQLEAERAAEAKENLSRKTRGDLTEADFEALTLANQDVANREDSVAASILRRDLEDERLAQERVLSDLTRDLLSLQSSAAKTAGERREIELQLLEMAQKQAREDMLRSKEFKKLSPENQQAAIAKQDEYFGQQVSATNRSTMGPLEAWRDASLSSAKQVDEAYQAIAANGLDALNSGIVDAILNSKNLGDVFSNVAKQIMADLLSISVRRGITEPLGDLLFGGSGASGGSGGSGVVSAIGSFLKGKIPGFSSGVTDFGGGLAKVHAGELLVNLPKGTDVITASATSGMMAAGGAGGSAGGRAQIIHVEPSKYFDVRVAEVAGPQSVAAFSGARQAVPQDMAKTSRYSRGRR